MTILETVVLGLIAVAAYPYVGYPVLLYLLSRRHSEPAPQATHEWPTVTLVISAFNEEAVIEDKIRNIRELTYPHDRLRVLIGSDGSSDATVQKAIPAAMGAPYIEITDFNTRRGKPAVLHDLIERAESDIVALSDANTMFEPGAIERLARWFANPLVGAVCGRLRLTSRDSMDRSEVLYWRFETWLKARENRLGAVLGANGGIYAFRRAAYVPIPPDTITDDFVIPMLIRTLGYHIVFDESAVATEEVAPKVAHEFTRRIRIGAGNLQALWRTQSLLRPSAGWTAFAYWSHKVLRWSAPLWLLVAILMSLLRIQSPILKSVALGGAVVFASAAAGWFLERAGRTAPRILAAPYAFVAMNLALLIGGVQLLQGKNHARWSRTPRGVEVPDS